MGVQERRTWRGRIVSSICGLRSARRRLRHVVIRSQADAVIPVGASDPSGDEAPRAWKRRPDSIAAKRPGDCVRRAPGGELEGAVRLTGKRHTAESRA